MAVRIVVDKQVVLGRTRNVSRGGLCADVADAIEIGSEVQLDVVLVFDDDLRSEALRLPARVVWCTTLDDAYQIGVAFKPLDAERAKHVQMFLAYLGDERAAKPPRTEKSIDDRFR